MKTRIALACVTALAVAALVGASMATAEEHDGELPAGGGAARALYVALGDSLAVGTGAHSEAQRGYVSHVLRFARIVSRGEVGALTNLAVGGETSATLSSSGQLAAGLAAIGDPDSDTRLVTLAIGGDDLLPLLTQQPCAGDPLGEACQAIVAGQLAGLAANLPGSSARCRPR